jgi:pyruvate dehydrogenase kinase 2/3/4
MQTLPYAVVANHHLAHVYELYYRAFERFRKIPEVRSIKDNDAFCDNIRHMLKDHLTVIPRLAIGVLEVQHFMSPEAIDTFVTTMLRSVSTTATGRCNLQVLICGSVFLAASLPSSILL